MKRIIWIAVIACFLLTIGVAVAAADASGTTGGLTWSISDHVLTISGTGAMPDYQYDPATPGGKYDDPEPEWCSTPWWDLSLRGSFSRIEVGEGVTKIGAYAFYECWGVTQVSLPSTLTEIGAHAFDDDTRLTQVDFPESLVTIGSSAFYQTGLAGTVTLPNSLETLGNYALNCRGITEVVFGSGLRTMDLNSVPTGAALTSAAGNNGTYDNLTWCLAGHVLLIKGSGDMPAFTRTAVTYKGDFSHYEYSMPWYEWELRGQVTRVMLYSGITSVSAHAFRAMSNLTSVALPYTVTSIGAEAFYGCSKLESLYIPSQVTSVGAGVFESCIKLQQVDIPSGVTTIPGNAFYGCSALKRISIPVSVTNIGQNAFYGCTDMEEVLYDCISYVSYTSYASYAGNWSFITFNGKFANPMAASGKAKLYCSGYLMGEVHLNSDSRSISPYAYYGCKNDFRIVANGGYTGEIGEYAFYNCTGLYTADLPTSVSVVNQYAFYGCSAMSNTYQLFDGLTYIGDRAFYGCSALVSVNQNYYSGRVLTYLGFGAFENCTQLATVRMNMSGGTIKEAAFYMCSALNSVTFLKKAPETISTYTFDCSSSPLINYYDGASWEGKIKNYGGILTWKAVGGSCGANATWKITDESCLVISGSGEVTGEAWRDESGITGLVIGDDITGAANVSFGKVTGAKQGTLDGGDYWVLTPAGVLHVFGTAAMPDMKADHSTWQGTVADARIHEGVTKIGANAFHSEYCMGMTNIRFPGTLTEIGQSAFEGCAGLTNLYFPDPVPTVYPDAFAGVTANACYLCGSQPGTISSGNLTWRTYCAWENGAAVPHELEEEEALEPACTENGHIGYWHCTKCDNLFEEENAVQILEEEDVLLAKTGHRWTTEPSFLWADNGKACEVTFTCLNCGLTDVTEAEISGETVEEPTDTAGGVTGYTATAISPDGKTYTNTKRIADLPARFTWSGTTITRYNLAEERVIIPASATELGPVAFKNCASVKSIIIPDSVTAIGPNTFGGCSGELTICSGEGAYAHTYALGKGIRWELYNRGPEFSGRIGMGDFGADMDAVAEYYVAEQIGFDAADGEVYSTDRLFTWEIRNMNEVARLYDAEPAFTVTLESGDVAFSADTFASGNKAGIEVRMTEMPAAGTAEFKAVCTIGDETYEQTVQFAFTGITSLPGGLEGDLSSPKIWKIGDELPFCPQISFADGWSADGESCGTLYGAGDEFFELVDWQDVCSVAKTGMAEVPLVAYSANLCMQKTVTWIFINADGTMPAGRYTPVGTVITLPAAITEIESEAFAGTRITEADIPAGTEIADDAFAGTGLIAVYTHNDEDTIDWAVRNGIVALTE